jgi:hypothetical protein
MTALVTSLKRIWSATGRIPCLTGWGNSGSRKIPNDETTLARWVHEWILDFLGVVRRTAPAAIVIACNLFR